MKYAALIRPLVMSLARGIIRSLGRTEIERELGEALVAYIDLGQKLALGTTTVRDWATAGNEMEEAVVAFVKSAHGQGGVDRYKEARVKVTK